MSGAPVSGSGGGMLRKLGFWFIVAQFLTFPLWGADRPAWISGQVRNASGVPQMGAAVEVLGSAMETFEAFTDENGLYSVRGLVPGTYSIRVSAPSFLTAIRDRVALQPGVGTVVNVTLSSLFEAIQLTPARAGSDGDDWKWVLRSAANRPILRFQAGRLSSATSETRTHASAFRDVTGTLSFVAGSSSDGFGAASDMSTDFSLAKPLFSTGVIAFTGNVGYGDAAPASVLRAAYSENRGDGAGPKIALTMRNLASPDLNLRNSDFQSIELNTSDDVALGDILEMKFGSELETVQFLGRVSAFRPFGSADFHVSPETMVEYSYATSEPDDFAEKGFDRATSDLNDSGPRMSISGYRASLERAHHQELSLSHRVGKSTLQLAAYSERISDPALTGVGVYSAVAGEVLPDVYSGTFTYRGRKLDSHGMRAVLEQKLNSNLTATFDYAYGGALELSNADAGLEAVREWSRVRQRHALTAKMKGTLPGAKTYWIASYRWTNGHVLTPVDLFNASLGQADPYLNLFFRQPIPGSGFLPNHIEVMVDLRNLLAQGYVPVVGQDGRTVYLVQSARSVRGGLAFIF